MLSRAETRLAKQNSENYSLSIGSAFDLKVGDASVDMLVNNYMFDLVPFNQMDKIIGEFKRVLKSDGKLILINMTKSEVLSVVSTKIFIVYHHVFWVGAAGFK
jgi:ubiquinone/menaquinone biosynthesis C-methylase UbiE